MQEEHIQNRPSIADRPLLKKYMQTNRNGYRGNAVSQRIAERAYEDIHRIADRTCRQKSVANKANAERQRNADRLKIWQTEQEMQTKNIQRHTEHDRQNTCRQTEHYLQGKCKQMEYFKTKQRIADLKRRVQRTYRQTDYSRWNTSERQRMVFLRSRKVICKKFRKN